jgi:hypothetical protein
VPDLPGMDAGGEASQSAALPCTPATLPPTLDCSKMLCCWAVLAARCAAGCWSAHRGLRTKVCRLWSNGELAEAATAVAVAASGDESWLLMERLLLK